MDVLENKTIQVKKPRKNLDWLTVSNLLRSHFSNTEVPIRIVLANVSRNNLLFEVSLLNSSRKQKWGDIWTLHKRDKSRRNHFVVISIIPTGIRAEIGGFAGDATPATNLLASTCDYLITNPNSVTASDLYFAKDNVLYTEGNLISRFMLGQIKLSPAPPQKIGLLIDKPYSKGLLNNVLNAVNAMHAVAGIRIDPVVVSKKHLKAKAFYSQSKITIGTITNVKHLLDSVSKIESEVDALAITSEVYVDEQTRNKYLKGAIIPNPWGGSEAILTHLVTTFSSIPAAHAPMMCLWNRVIVKDIVDPRDAAEVICTDYLCSVLRGLKSSPRPIKTSNTREYNNSDLISINDVSAIVLPVGALGGIPAFAAASQKIPIILVKENSSSVQISEKDIFPDKHNLPCIYYVNNYAEAAGLLLAFRNNIAPSSIRRPILRAKYKNI